MPTEQDQDTGKRVSSGNDGLPGPPLPRRERFESHFRPSDPASCWPWLGERSDKGYGLARSYPGKFRHKAHRVSYQFYRGPIPTGHTINHLCGNKACVNPYHLEIATSLQNTRHYWRRLRNG